MRTLRPALSHLFLVHLCLHLLFIEHLPVVKLLPLLHQLPLHLFAADDLSPSLDVRAQALLLSPLEVLHLLLLLHLHLEETQVLVLPPQFFLSASRKVIDCSLSVALELLLLLRELRLPSLGLGKDHRLEVLLKDEVLLLCSATDPVLEHLLVVKENVTSTKGDAKVFVGWGFVLQRA